MKFEGLSSKEKEYMNKTGISINGLTKARLAKFGIKSETWDSILNSLMNHAVKCDRYWENRN